MLIPGELVLTLSEPTLGTEVSEAVSFVGV